VSVRQQRRLERLEQARGGKERLRVVEWWPGEPRPQAELGELLVVLRQFFPRDDGQQAGRGAAA
jgi:hypothetical protein